MPAQFHSVDYFNQMLSILRKALGDSSVSEVGTIDAPLLLFGLVYREVSRSLEIEPGASTNAPDHLVNSPFGIQEMDQLETLIEASL